MPRRSRICYIVLSLGFILFLIGAAPATTSVAEVDDVLQSPKDAVVANVAPVAVDDSYETNEDTPLSIPTPGILANDSDMDGDAFHVEPVEMPSNGVIVLYADGSFVYTPKQDWSGIDSFKYQVADGAGGTSNEATVTITVLPVNDAPVGQDDSYSTDEDGILVVVAADGVLANDGDIEGDPLFISDTLGPTHGILTPLPDGSFTYTPNDDFNGLDSFDYEVSDGVLTDMATVTITVTPVNDAPVAEDDSYTTNEDSPLSIAVPGVLANDSDVDGDSLFVTLFSDPSNGTLTFNGDGSFIYTPDDDFNGLDSFDYEVSDGVLTNTATVTITVLSVNDVPMAMDDTAETNEDVPVEIDVLANDYDVEGDPLVILAIDYGSANGVAELVDLDGSIAVRYTPDPDWNGNTWFAYTLYILDGSWVPQSTGTVYITVYPVNDAPTAVIDYVMTDEDTPIWIDVLANDYDVDGDSVLFGYQITSNADELNGVASISGDGVYYEPNPDWHGTTTSLRYEIRDPSGVTAWGEIHITVASVPDAPVAEDDSYVIEEDAVLLVDAMGGVLANDTDIDGDSLIALVHSMPSSGALILNADGSFSYTPEQNFYGLDSFTYKATDGLLDSTIITVIITVTGVDDEPVAMDDTYVTYVDISLTVPAPGILENDYDVDDEPITEITLTSWPSYGELLEVNADGSFVYIPDTGWSGSVSFSYQVLTSSLSNEATVYITVRVIPVAEDDAYQTDEDTPLIVEQPGVFINDADVDLDIHYAVLVMDALNGTVVLNADGSFSFSPDADFAGIDSFTYFVSDGVEYSNVATVTLTVNPVNDASVAVDDFAVTDEDTPVWIDVLNNDYDVDGDLFELWSIVSGSEIHGMAEIMDDAGLIKILYTPNPNWHGEAWFAYEIYALEGAAWVLQDTGNVYVTVNSVLDAPVAEDDFYTTDEDMPLQIDAAAGVLANDSDGDVDSLTAIIITEPSNGLLVLNDDGSFVYTPNENWFGEDSFAYRVSDGLLTDTGTVTITTNSVDDAPVAVDDFAVTDEDIPVWIDVLNNDYDVDGDIIELWSINDEPGHGVAEIIDDAGWIRILYTPDPDWSGIDSFTYQCYSISISNVATVTITVLDKTPPITTESLDRPPDYNGWYSGDVTVTLSVTDTGPGVVTTKYRYGGIPWTLYTGPFRISAEGRHTLLFNSTDESGNVEGMNTKIILIDKTHPITEMYFETSWGSIIDDYGVRWTQNPVKLYYQYLLSGDSVSGVPIVDDTVWPPLYAVQYKIDDGPWIYLNGAQINPDEYGTPTTDFGVLLETIDTDGIHTVYWYSIDAAGNVERPRQFTFGIDTTPPEVAVTIDGVEGENGWYVTAANILYRATDYVTGLARTDQFDPDSTYFSYSIDSGPVITAALMMGVDFQYSFSTEGKHLFEAWVSDNSDVSGNVNYTAFSIWIDTTTPVNSISLGGTLGDNAWYTSDVMATFTVSDALSGVGWGYFLLYDAQGSWYYSEENTYSAAGSVEVMLTASVESGEIWAWMNTSDVAGNWVIDELVFKIDKTAPTTEASPDRPPYLDDWYISSVTMTLLSYDGFSGVSETLYSINGGSWVVYSVPIDISTEGVNTVSYISTDNAGNVETGSVVVRIDDDVTPPEITLAYTGDGTDGNPGTWIVTILDAESGVASITVEINGFEVGTSAGDYPLSNILGTYTINVTASNADLDRGLLDQEKVTVIESIIIVDDDTTGPIVTITLSESPLIPNDQDSGVWTVLVNDPESSIETMIVEIDGAIVGDALGDYPVPLLAGIHTITVTATNADLDRGSGDQEMTMESATVTVYDVTAPNTTLSVGSPFVDQCITSSTSLEFYSEDGNGFGVETINYKVNDGLWQVYDGSFYLTGDDGEYTLYYYAVDVVCNVESEHSRIFTLDNSPPSTTILLGLPTHDSYITSATPITLEADDLGSGTALIRYRIDEGDWSLYTSAFEFVGPDGTYMIEFYSEDQLGNTESINMVSIKLDNTAPTTQITPSGTLGDNDWFVSQVYLALTADDGAGSGVASIYYVLDSGAMMLFTGIIEVSEDGLHVIEFWSEDNLGNLETTHGVFEFKIDKTSPDAFPPVTTLEVLIPAFGTDPTYISNTTGIVLEATDELSGVYKIQYRIDAGEWIDYVTAFTVDEIGSHMIYYRSIDVAGNEEIEKFIWVVVNASEVTYSGEISGQYSDPVVLNATLIDIATQLPIVGKTVTFVLGLQSASAVTGTDGIACTTIILDQAAGVYTLTATFESDGMYLGSFEETEFILEKENAFASYTGSTVVSSHLEAFTLRATIYDEDDNYWGDLTRIYITLTIYNDEMDISSPVLVEGPHIVEITEVEGVGVVIVETPNLPVAAYLIVVSFEVEDNGYYQGLDSDTVTLTIYEPSGDFVTGSGWIWDSSGHLGHFGFIVRYRWDGILRGTFLYVYTDDDSIVIVKGTEWIGLAITDNHAFFEAKCFIVQLNFRTCEFQYSDDSYTVKVDAWDNDFDGGVDVFQMRVYDENGLIWHEAGYEPYGYLVCGNIRIYRRYY